MQVHSRLLSAALVAVAAAGPLRAGSAWAQSQGSITGHVMLTADRGPVHGAVVLVVRSGRSAVTDEEGRFVIENVAPGTYEVLAQREHLTAERQSITVMAGQAAAAEFMLDLSPVHEEITVTATAIGQATTFEAFNATTTLDSFDLTANPSGTLGEVLENQAGIVNRTFGPGSSRPIIRGFDGDRVLIMQDGMRTGDLASQSGDHGVTIDPNSLERVEIVRGPATLLYGSNAVGGVVNAISPHESYRDWFNQGTRGQVGFDLGSANWQAGSAGSVQHAQGRALFWAGGGSRRASDYNTPIGRVENSATRLSNGRAGVGYFGDRLFASGGITLEDSRYGIPFAGALHGHHGEEEAHEGEDDHDEGQEHDDEPLVDLASQRRVGRFDVGMRNLGGAVDSFRLVFNVIDWRHDELEILDGVESIGTAFSNRSYVFRADMTQRQTSRLSGRFGVWGQHRDYSAAGAEALAPPTGQTAFAGFGYEELRYGRLSLQVGGRVERNDYSVSARPGAQEGEAGEPGHADEEESHVGEPPEVRDRSFTGASASFGVHADIAADTALVANLTQSHRAPALEELYNFGPHVGNLAFEIGNPDLESESTTGLDVSLRHRSANLRGSVNVYLYDVTNFVFLDIEDEVVNNLRVADFAQGDSRFVGFDAQGSVRLGGRVWAELRLGMVDATLTATDEPLPRIPPLRGQLSIDIPHGGLTITPEWVFSAQQDRVFRDEVVTDGYSLLNLKVSYVYPARHFAHVLSVTGYNLTGELYRNHTSFIKDLVPEMGRGLKVGYSVRFF